MKDSTYLLTLSILFGTVLLVFGMRYLAKWREATARLARDDAWRRTAESAAAAQAETAASLSALQTALADVGGRISAVEAILKAVE